MTSETTYNGWTNYETWRINLEIVDDYINSISEDISAGYQEPFGGLAELSDAISEHVDECITGFGEVSDELLAVQYAQVFAGEANYYEMAKTHAEDHPHLIATEDDED